MLVEGMVQIVGQKCAFCAFLMQVSQEQILERAGRLDDSSRALGFIDETGILVTRINI